jgi:CBS domain-containing protein
MNVETLCTRNIVRIRRSATLEQAAALMRDHHVGALLVWEEAPDGVRTVGIVTDRDIVTRAIAHGTAPRDCIVGQVMSADVATVPLSASLPDALEIMRAQGVRRLVVLEPSGAPAGILSIDDMVDALTSQLAGVGGVLRQGFEREITRRRGT